MTEVNCTIRRLILPHFPLYQVNHEYATADHNTGQAMTCTGIPLVEKNLRCRITGASASSIIGGTLVEGGI